MSNGRILIVEDDYDISNMLRIFFSNEGYQVEIAARGNDALEKCRRKLPDLIVLDIMLPDMDGYEVCRAMRTTTRTSHIPIIFLTQKDDRSDRIAGLELGADDYITKPFDIEELKLRVRTSIRIHQRQNMTNPTTGLPSSRLIEEQLRRSCALPIGAICKLALITSVILMTPMALWPAMKCCVLRPYYLMK
ncbi:MAG: response regulator [Chloroflexi bacterium]|nr:response regulator [Chloroflexota bacterium]